MPKVKHYRDQRLLWLFRAIDFLVPISLLFILQQTLTGQMPWHERYLAMGLVGGLMLVAITELFQGYSQYSQKTFARKLEITVKAWTTTALLLIFLAFLYQDAINFSRRAIVSWFVLIPFVTLGLKLLAPKLFKIKKRTPTRVLFLGQAYQLNQHEQAQLKSMQVITDSATPFDVESKVQSFRPDYIVTNLNEPAQAELIKYLTSQELKGTGFLSMNSFMEAFLRKCFIPYDNHNLDYLNQIQPLNTYQRFWKTVIDLSGSLALLCISWPVMIYATYKIKKESPGNTLFTQERISLQGQPFMVKKFRSMREDCHFDPYTQKEDCRVFAFGKTMRKARLDELPQIWNILKREMSLIGPRAEWSLLVERYEDSIPYYHERHIIRPGITGWAQVMYPYGADTEDARQKLMYDLYYIKHWSIWLEAETILRTIRVIVSKKGL